MKKQISVRMKKTLLERIDPVCRKQTDHKNAGCRKLLQSVLSKQK